MMDAYSRRSVTVIFTPCRRRHSPYLTLCTERFITLFSLMRGTYKPWEKLGKRFTLFYSVSELWVYGVTMRVEIYCVVEWWIYIYIYLCVNSLQTIVALTQIFFSRFTEHEGKYFFINSIASHCRVNTDFFPVDLLDMKGKLRRLILHSSLFFVHLVSRCEIEISATLSCISCRFK